jgi:nitrogen fixation/metabolism regulation signal transduction histidine kinase
MGLMVSEYNRMVENLEKSKLELVRSQRELAWREMARQVAHEIRNPLTPIRLTIQRLLTRSSAAGTHAVETEKALKSVLMQTEILSAIADSFSALSGLPALKPEKVDLMASVREDVALFMNADAGAITVTGAEDSVFIRFDRKFLSRILSNLILNARQSSVDPVDIFITIRESESGALLIVRDTGGGIEESLREKIFTPNFTTKKTGAGLGLWLCKQGIEQMGGSIRFESAASENGTTFIISWPLYRA